MFTIRDGARVAAAFNVLEKPAAAPRSTGSTRSRGPGAGAEALAQLLSSSGGGADGGARGALTAETLRDQRAVGRAGLSVLRAQPRRAVWVGLGARNASAVNTAT